jgi:hypothetical protein
MNVLRSVMSWIGLAGVLSCTAPNPAYHVEDLGSRDGDASRTPSPGSDAASPEAGASAGGSTVCGTARPPLTDLVAVDSMVIDARGNIYFSNDDGTNAWIGKLPPIGGTADKHWRNVSVGPPIRGMALDDVHGVVYFTAGATPELQAVDLNGSGVRTVSRSLVDPNDVAMGPDGNVYVSDQGDTTIYSFTPDGKRTKVANTAIGVRAMNSGPAGLAFAPDGALVVGYKGRGQLIRITLDHGVESGRQTFGPTMDWVNGLVYDQRGRLYLAQFDQTAPRDVIRLDSDAATPVPFASGGHFSALVFGRGELDCNDLYISDPFAGAMVRRFPVPP